MAPKIHPLIDNGIKKGDSGKQGGKLYCKCSGSSRVEVSLGSNVAHNHACGWYVARCQSRDVETSTRLTNRSSKCWKPQGSLFSVVGVVPTDQVTVTSNGDKLKAIDTSAVIQRYACKSCGVHMYGRIEQAHAFKGLDFVHAELSDTSGWQEPQFAAFCASIIEQGFDPEK